MFGIGKGILIIMAAMGISFAYYNLIRYKSSKEAGGQTADYQYKTLAREVAKTGLSHARQAIADGKKADIITGTVSGGTYRTVLSKGGATYRIESQGRMTDTRSRPVVWKIYVDYQRKPIATPTEVPPFLDYALMSNGGLQLAGSMSVNLATWADAENANVHTNGSLKITGNSVDVLGFGTHSLGASSSPSGAIGTTFTPGENEYDRSSVLEVPQIEVPEFTVANYIDKVVPDMITGPVTLSGDYALSGTREDPYVWVVNGDLVATGSTTLDGYVLFLVDGNINLSSNVAVGMGATGSTESTMAFYASGDIIFNGTIDIYGQFLAGGDFIVEGTPTIYGSVATSGSAILKGTPNLNYLKASPALAQIWNDGDPELYRLISYHEALERTFEDKTDLFVSGVK